MKDKTRIQIAEKQVWVLNGKILDIKEILARPDMKQKQKLHEITIIVNR